MKFITSKIKQRKLRKIPEIKLKSRKKLQNQALTIKFGVEKN